MVTISLFFTWRACPKPFQPTTFQAHVSTEHSMIKMVFLQNGMIIKFFANFSRTANRHGFLAEQHNHGVLNNYNMGMIVLMVFDECRTVEQPQHGHDRFLELQQRQLQLCAVEFALQRTQGTQRTLEQGLFPQYVADQTNVLEAFAFSFR